MNNSIKLKAISLLWGCVYIAVLVTRCGSNSIPTENITIVPLNETSHFTINSSVDTYGYTEVKPANTNDISNDTTTDIGNNTSTAPDNDKESDGSRLNLAIIPVVGILILLTVLCLKCCSWFRQYSRGGDKDNPNQYDIVEQGDIDYDQIDMKSDTASTAYYDTVSSFCSLLRRNDTETNACSYKGSKLEQLNQDNNVNSKVLRDFRKKMIELDIAHIELTEIDGVVGNEMKPLKDESESTEIDTYHKETSSPLTNSPKRRCTRTPSGSSDVSADTEQSLLSDTDRDTPKRQRFKVSFGVEDKEKGRNNKQVKDVNSIKPILPKTKVLNTTMPDGSDPHKPRTCSPTTPQRTAIDSQVQNNTVNRSSKLVCRVDIERDMFGNKIVLSSPTKRSQVSSKHSERPAKKEKAHCISESTSDENRAFLARKVPYRSVRSKSDIVAAQTEIVCSSFTSTRDCGTQTDKSFRLSLRKGRKRYSSEGYADDNVIPPTISELAEMCPCKTAKCNNPLPGDTKCTCDNILDDLTCDDVFEATEPVINNNVSVNAVCDKESVQREVIIRDAENRLTNHERNNGAPVQCLREALSNTNSDDGEIDDKFDSFNSGFAKTFCPSKMANATGKLSLSMHNLMERDINSCDGLLGKYCDQCHNFNTSVPNLCYAYQRHSPIADIISSSVQKKTIKNKCKTCSQHPGIHITSLGQLERHGEVLEKQSKFSALDILKRESSVASDDLSFSSSSLSSSGYAEISSDVSSL